MNAGIVIVTHNSSACLERCLMAAVATGWPTVVVDNASEDDSCRLASRFAAVRVECNSTNRGFAAAVNQGVRSLEAGYILILNPDAVIREGVGVLLEECSRPGVGAAAGLLIGPDGRPQRGFSVRRFPTATALACEVLGINRLWPSNPVNRRYRCLDLDLDRPAEVEQPAGAFLMIRREAWTQVGGFDESFHPVWFEDVDFLKRLHDSGWSIRFQPAARAEHLGGHSVHRLTACKRLNFWYASLLKYAAKHLPRGGCRWVALAVMAGVTVRMLAKVAGERSFRPFRHHLNVIRLAWSRFSSDWSRMEGSVPRMAQAAKTVHKESS